MADPYATNTQAKSAYAGVNGNATRLDAVMRVAAAKVQKIAPAPTPEPSDYEDLAVAAELIYGEWLWRTGGYKTSESIGGASRSYSSRSQVESAIADVMGDYTTSGASANVGLVGGFPPA